MFGFIRQAIPISRPIHLVCGLLCCLSWRVDAGDASQLAISTFFQKPKYGAAVLSPSGRYLAVVTPINDRLNLGVIDLEARSVSAVTAFNDADVFRVVWQSDDRMVLFWGDLHRGTEEPTYVYGIWAVDRDGGNPLRLDRRQEGAHTLGWRFPSTLQFVRSIPGTNGVLVSAFERTRTSRDLYRVDTKTGARTLLSYETPAPAERWVLDFDNVPRAVVTYDLDHDKSGWYVRKEANAPWVRVEEAALGRLTTTPLQFSADGKILYVEGRRNADRSAIYEYEIESGKWTGPVVQHAERDIVASPVMDLSQHKLLGLRYQDDKLGVIWFEPEWAMMQKSVDAALPDVVNVLQRASIGDRWIVISYSDRNPGDVYLLDGKTLKMEKLFSYEPWIRPVEMASTQWVRYRSRDGLTVPALLTVPTEASGKPAPLIVYIHGGPNVQATSWRYATDVQFLASRGYAVLQPQFRGTNGFGWRFFSAGFRKWGDEMQDDLEDGVKWAVEHGIADPDRVCFYGGSYGGYAAMWGAIKNAKLIKCAVAIAGVSSIEYMFDNAQTDISEFAEKSTLMVEWIGDPKTERARFKRVSPLSNADKVQVPILLAYGAKDLRVPLAHGADFRAALDNYGKSYEWVLYSDEGHGFNKDENLFDFYGRVERFLAKYLSANPAATK